MRSARLLLPVALLAAVVGGLTGALVTLALTDPEDSAPPDRGTVVAIGAELGFEDGVWCSEHLRFCIPEFEQPQDAHAFYMMDPHGSSRARGCVLDWRLDIDIANFTDQATAERLGPGLFRARCSGSTFLSDGTRVFGPSPRNLDEFAISYHEETREFRDGEEYLDRWFEVDTRTLICGDLGRGVDPDDVPDPGCELAPPYD